MTANENSESHIFRYQHVANECEACVHGIDTPAVGMSFATDEGRVLVTVPPSTVHSLIYKLLVALEQCKAAHPEQPIRTFALPATEFSIVQTGGVRNLKISISDAGTLRFTSPEVALDKLKRELFPSDYDDYETGKFDNKTRQ